MADGTLVVSAIPLVIDRLLELAQASKGTTGGLDSGVTIDDGRSNKQNTGKRITVGADDPDEDRVTAASAIQEWAHATGTARNDEGDIVCTAMAWNGDGDAKRARDDAFAMAAVFAGFCVTDYTLGIPVLLWAAFGGQVDLTYLINDTGITAVVVFRIHFKARI